jgi:hypothetical protein
VARSFARLRPPLPEGAGSCRPGHHRAARAAGLDEQPVWAFSRRMGFRSPASLTEAERSSGTALAVFESRPGSKHQTLTGAATKSIGSSNPHAGGGRLRARLSPLDRAHGLHPRTRFARTISRRLPRETNELRRWVTTFSPSSLNSSTPVLASRGSPSSSGTRPRAIARAHRHRRSWNGAPLSARRERHDPGIGRVYSPDEAIKPGTVRRFRSPWARLRR